MKKEDEHPLRVVDVFDRAGMTNYPKEHQIFVTCDDCGVEQTLAEAPVALANDPSNITDYRCLHCSAVVTVTGFPGPIPLPGAGRYWLGDYCVQPMVSDGWQIRMR